MNERIITQTFIQIKGYPFMTDCLFFVEALANVVAL